MTLYCEICGAKINEELASETMLEMQICSICMTGKSDAEREAEYYEFEQLIEGDFR